MSDMETTLRDFQRNFAKARRAAERGATVRIRGKQGDYIFKAEKPAKGIWGLTAGQADLSKLHEDGPFIPLKEWGDLA
ncbi:hypothetical protein MASR2M8_02340 [Opitutaceae bacterium]